MAVGMLDFNRKGITKKEVAKAIAMLLIRKRLNF